VATARQGTRHCDVARRWPLAVTGGRKISCHE
jgi:hypothetical protein